jgi:hypothetical protein
MSPIWPTPTLTQRAAPVLLSIGMASMVGNSARLTSFTAASASWPAADRAYLVPFSLDFPFTVRRVLAYNGSTVAGNFDIGVYDRYGSLIFNIGSTAQSGASVIQQVALGSPIELPPGIYGMAISRSSTSATNFRAAVPQNLLTAAGMRQRDSSLPLPSTFSGFGSMATDHLPVFGIASVDVI